MILADSQPRHHQHSLGALGPAAHSTSEISSDYDRRVSAFNHKRHPMKPQYQTRVISWSDPVTARDIIDDSGDKKRVSSPLSRNMLDGMETESMVGVGGEDGMNGGGGWDGRRNRFLRGRRSFDDAEKLKGTRILPVEYMRTDVELCGQLLVMHRREEHLANVLACLQAVTQTLSTSNATLRNDLEGNRPAFDELQNQAGILLEIESLRKKADAMTQETNALAYESDQFRVKELYHMASQPRMRVLEYREKVFGTGRRLRQGVHGAHGQFNRVQWTIDGKERLVDMWGRTESEEEEEEEVPGAHVVVPEDEEPEVVEHQSLRPTWVLNIFNYLGSKWGSLGKDTGSSSTIKDAGCASGSASATEGRSPASDSSVESPLSNGENGNGLGSTQKLKQRSNPALSSSVELVDSRTAFARHFSDQQLPDPQL